jgi:hypothetical protein
LKQLKPLLWERWSKCRDGIGQLVSSSRIGPERRYKAFVGTHAICLTAIFQTKIYDRKEDWQPISANVLPDLLTAVETDLADLNGAVAMNMLDLVRLPPIVHPVAVDYAIRQALANARIMRGYWHAEPKVKIGSADRFLNFKTPRNFQRDTYRYLAWHVVDPGAADKILADTDVLISAAHKAASLAVRMK